MNERYANEREMNSIRVGLDQKLKASVAAPDRNLARLLADRDPDLNVCKMFRLRERSRPAISTHVSHG